MPEFFGPFFQEVHFLILFQYLEEKVFEEEVVLTPDVAVVKVAKEKIMNEKTSTCFLQESLYYNLMVYVVGVIFTVSIVAYAVYQTYQVICHNSFLRNLDFAWMDFTVIQRKKMNYPPELPLGARSCPEK